MTHSSYFVGPAIAVLCCCATSALAEDNRDGSEQAVLTPENLQHSGDLIAELGKDAPSPLSPEELAETRGTSTIVLSNQTLEAITSGNSIGDYLAGTISLSENALSSFNGVGNFLFNTGAQNNLQAGMSLTITIE